MIDGYVILASLALTATLTLTFAAIDIALGTALEWVKRRRRR